MSDKTLKEAVDAWQYEADKLVEETRKVGTVASIELKKQIKMLQEEGEKLSVSIKEGREDANYKLRTELESKYNLVQDKLMRAWEELNK